MTQETFNHDNLEAFDTIEEGQRWFEEHQAAIGDLQSILKHVSPDGETITAPKADHQEVTTEALDTTDTDTVTVNIPSDYDTAHGAVQDLSKRQMPVGSIIEINIESGHNLQRGITCRDGFYGHFVIKSEDATVTVAEDWPTSDPEHSPVYGVNAWMPALDTIIDMDSKGGEWAEGYWARRFSRGWVKRGAGIKNSPRHGIKSEKGSVVHAREAVATGSTKANAYCTEASFMNIPSADLSDAGENAIQCTRKGVVDAHNASGRTDATGAGASGVVSRFGGKVHAEGIDVSNSATGLRAVDGGEIIASDVVSNNCTAANAIVAEDGGKIVVDGGEVTGSSGRSLRADTAEIYARNADLSGAGSDAVYAFEGGRIVAPNSDASNAGGIGYRTNRGSEIVCTGGDAAGADSTEIVIQDGSTVYAHNCNTTNGSPAVGDTIASELNAIEGDRGIIWG